MATSSSSTKHMEGVRMLTSKYRHAMGATGMAVIPMKVRARNSDQRVITYAFLDSSSNSSFCTESLMKQLRISGQQVKISLSTLEKKNSIANSFLVRYLLVFDLDENEWVSLLTLHTRLEIPVCSNDIPTQEDVDQWPTCMESSCCISMLKLAF